MGTLWGSGVPLGSRVGSVLVGVFTNSLGSKSITETMGDGDEEIKEPLEEEEAALLRSSDKTRLMEANGQQLSARPSTALYSRSTVRLGEELL